MRPPDHDGSRPSWNLLPYFTPGYYMWWDWIMSGSRAGGPVRVVIYARISDDPDGSRAGVERQEADCRAEASRRGWEVVAVLVDNDVSASRYAKTKRRPGWDRAMAMLTNREADALLSYHSDRLTRRPRELEDLIDLVEKTRALVVTLAGEYDLTTDNGRAVARIVAAIDAQAADATSRRVRRAAFSHSQAGGRWWNGRQFGWDGPETVNLAEAAALRKAYEGIADGSATLSSVARDWNEAGLLPRKAPRWTITNVKAALLAPSHAGLVQRPLPPDADPNQEREPSFVEGTFGRIVEPALWHTVRLVLSDPKRKPPPGTVRLLTGLVRCSDCDDTMRRSGASKRQGPQFACRTTAGTGCGRRVAALPLEREVWAAVLSVFDGVVPEHSPEPDDRAAVAELAQIDARLADLGTKYADGLVPEAAFLAAAQRLRERRSEVASRVSVRTPSRPRQRWSEPGSLRKADEAGELTDADRNEVVRSVIGQIRVGPGTKGAKTPRLRIAPPLGEVRWLV